MGRASNGVVEVTGKVVLADMEGRRFKLRLSPGRTLLVPFTRRHESTVLRALAERLRLRVRGHGVRDRNGAVKSLARVLNVSLVAAQRHSARPEPDVWDMVQAAFADVPPEEWAKFPRDGAINHDHYIYGLPKVEP